MSHWALGLCYTGRVTVTSGAPPLPYFCLTSINHWEALVAPVLGLRNNSAVKLGIWFWRDIRIVTIQINVKTCISKGKSKNISSDIGRNFEPETGLLVQWSWH
ncbi:hypothetical protein DER44DRAFT_793540 [Fusarium oxysporum]|nr:hypothetical protein DER44DRAFT_793540 [Fusarium oxysporum]